MGVHQRARPPSIAIKSIRVAKNGKKMTPCEEEQLHCIATTATLRTKIPSWPPQPIPSLYIHIRKPHIQTRYSMHLYFAPPPVEARRIMRHNRGRSCPCSRSRSRRRRPSNPGAHYTAAAAAGAAQSMPRRHANDRPVTVGVRVVRRRGHRSRSTPRPSPLPRTPTATTVRCRDLLGNREEERP